MWLSIKRFLWTSLLGGIGVFLPVVLSAFLFNWLYVALTDAIQILTDMVMERGVAAEWLADLLVIALLVTTCFFTGLLVRTGVGNFIHTRLEQGFLAKFPGYTIIKETVQQFVGDKKSPFSQVALVQVFGSHSETLMTAFVTDDSQKDMWTVFVPTGPNPTSGNIYHLPVSTITVIDISVETAMRSIISCGAGSASLLEAYHQALEAKLPDQEP